MWRRLCVSSFVVRAACPKNARFPRAEQQVCPGVWASSVPAGSFEFRVVPLPNTHLFGHCCVNVLGGSGSVVSILKPISPGWIHVRIKSNPVQEVQYTQEHTTICVLATLEI